MERNSWVGILVVGALITLAGVSAACSSQTAEEAAPPAIEDVNRSIKVYESPT
ncbi:MAG: hypothetical protein ACERKX_14980 [Anaerolineales bacterium]